MHIFNFFTGKDDDSICLRWMFNNMCEYKALISVCLYSIGLPDVAVNGRYLTHAADGARHAAPDPARKIRTPSRGSLQELSLERGSGRNGVL